MLRIADLLAQDKSLLIRMISCPLLLSFVSASIGEPNTISGLGGKMLSDSASPVRSRDHGAFSQKSTPSNIATGGSLCRTRTAGPPQQRRSNSAKKAGDPGDMDRREAGEVRGETCCAADDEAVLTVEGIERFFAEEAAGSADVGRIREAED